MLVRELEAELKSLKDLSSSAYSKRVFQLVASARYGRYLRRTSTGKLRLDRTAVRAAERNDGKFVVHSNDDTLSFDGRVGVIHWRASERSTAGLVGRADSDPPRPLLPGSSPLRVGASADAADGRVRGPVSS